MSSDRIESLRQEARTHKPNDAFVKTAYVTSEAHYAELYAESLQNPHDFWLKQAQSLQWEVFPQKTLESNWDIARGVITHSWFADGRLNVAQNCLDRHLRTPLADAPAILWQSEDFKSERKISYRELHALVCQFANVLIEKGIKKGDRVCLYLPMIPEAVVAMLACARLGAIHSVVFAGFSAAALSARFADSQCRLVVTADATVRGGKTIALKTVVDEALQQNQTVQSVIVVAHLKNKVALQSGRDCWWHDVMAKAQTRHDAVSHAAEDPLFILYTSGSASKPKGVLHTQAGYLLYAARTFHYIFDYHPGDVYWCTADVGWITGHSYLVYGPLANGATILMYEGIPSYPDYGRFWQIVEKYRVNIFYTAPTAIRAIMTAGEAWPKRYDLTSLRLLGSVGEPIHPKVWEWYYDKIGQRHCPIVDTWWQTETGGIVVSTLPGVHAMHPGSAGRPFFGIEPVLLREDGSACAVGEGGHFCIKKPWPGMMRRMWGDSEGLFKAYFEKFPNLYDTGDICQKDEHGAYWFLGRSDDVIKVSGHRIGTAEVESALMADARVAEAAVVGAPHAIKGESLYVFVLLKEGIVSSEDLVKQLQDHVVQQIGSIARPEVIQFVSGLPKTRSGKIMRRILKKIVMGDTQNLGDTTTLAERQVVEALVKDRATMPHF